MTDDFCLDACFLGPYAENDGLLEKLIVEFFRDHVYWRRNFHPEDPPAIPTGTSSRPEYQAFEAKLRHELHRLSAALKRSVPFHSPRYLGHMVSDLLIPGVAAQILTLPYNPNNVSEEAAPVTVDLEVRAGLQLARMLGYPDDTNRDDCAFGHLCSGGTVANYQALRLALALKAFPVALLAAQVPEISLPEDDWQAFNLNPPDALALLVSWQQWLARQSPAQRRLWQRRVQAERLEQRGMVDFFAGHRQLALPRVLAPITAHYSWSKGLKLLGLGRNQLQLLPEREMRLDIDALNEALLRCQRERQPVLMSVAVLGTTEYGTIDPVDGVVAARERSARKGLGHWVHIDGAWGGYLATLFRNPDGSLRSRDEVGRPFQSFPADTVHAAFAALANTDSVTVDPHKLGYLPYGAGAFVCRDGRAMELLREEADYVYHDANADSYMSRFRGLGQFIPEGSKSGATAAAVYVSHQVLPLDHAHFGRLQAQTIRSAEHFLGAAKRFATAMAEVARVCVPFPPDSNLVCLAINPLGNRDAGVANGFLRKLYQVLRCDPQQPLQIKAYFASTTTLRPDALGEVEMQRILQMLALDPATLGGDGDDRLLILRHTLMNPYLLDEHNDLSYIDGYFRFLGGEIRRLLNSAETSP